jgi:hypothetical protein
LVRGARRARRADRCGKAALPGAHGKINFISNTRYDFCHLFCKKPLPLSASHYRNEHTKWLELERVSAADLTFLFVRGWRPHFGEQHGDEMTVAFHNKTVLTTFGT